MEGIDLATKTFELGLDIKTLGQILVTALSLTGLYHLPHAVEAYLDSAYDFSNTVNERSFVEQIAYKYGFTNVFPHHYTFEDRSTTKKNGIFATKDKIRIPGWWVRKLALYDELVEEQYKSEDPDYEIIDQLEALILVELTTIGSHEPYHSVQARRGVNRIRPLSVNPNFPLNPSRYTQTLIAPEWTFNARYFLGSARDTVTIKYPNGHVEEVGYTTLVELHAEKYRVEVIRNINAEQESQDLGLSQEEKLAIADSSLTEYQLKALAPYLLLAAFREDYRTFSLMKDDNTERIVGFNKCLKKAFDLDTLKKADLNWPIGEAFMILKAYKIFVEKSSKEGNKLVRRLKYMGLHDDEIKFIVEYLRRLVASEIATDQETEIGVISVYTPSERIVNLTC